MTEFDQGVWIDYRTDLIWARTNIGQEWIDGQCIGEGKTLAWGEAYRACQNLTLAGYTDWRLPSIDELKTLMLDGKKGYNCPKKTLFPPSRWTVGSHWSITSYRNYINLAEYVNFYLGNVHYNGKAFIHHARAVRTREK